MSDLPPPDEAAPVSPIADDELPAVAEQFRPIFAELAKGIIAEAIASVPTPTMRPGRVTLVDSSTGVANVLVDGDTSETATQVICEHPIVGDRVMVMFVPPSAAFVVGIVGGGGVPAGTLAWFAGTITSDTGSETTTAPPRGWLWCHGQVVNQADYPALYAAIGTAYSAGGESDQQFRLPDLRGRTVFGLDNMGGTDAGRISTGNTLGTTGGAETVTLDSSNLPSHTHDLGSHTHSFTPSGSVSVSATAITVSGLVVGGGATQVPTGWSPGSASFSGNSGTTGGASGSTGSAGSSSAVNKMPPHIVLNACIKA